MSNKKLVNLDESLDIKNKKDKILINKRGFYIYYNEPNKKRKIIKIHTHTCGFCTWGSGRDTLTESGRNGVWIGPFNTQNQAYKFAKLFFGPDDYYFHFCCI